MSIFSVFKNDATERHPIIKGKSLLRPHRKTIVAIQSIVGLEKRFWNHLYLQTMINLAEYVQGLPASEAHHHSDVGGLLQHTLETTLNALRIRRGKLLPPNADAETVTRLKDLWTYAVFTGAIGHDLGKPITDIAVKLYDNKGVGRDWSPFKGSMRSTGARRYSIEYRRNRSYAAHGRSSVLYVHYIIPVTGLEWLASNSDVFFYWINLITGHEEESGIIGSIIHEADKASVAGNLAGDQTAVAPAANTSRKPLYQRIVTSLRYQIDQGHLPLNRDGAAGWIKDGALWVVVKRALDQVRDHMAQEGQTGIPARNDRIMDELQQFGVLKPCNNKAVWKCRVFGPQWVKAHELTMLCIPVEKLWPGEDAAPDEFDGSITPVAASGDTVNDISPEVAIESNQKPSAAIQENPKISQPPAPENAEQGPLTQAVISPAAQPEPPTIDFQVLASGGKEPPAPKPDSDKPESITHQSNPDPVSADSSAGTEQKTSAGTDFLEWLRDGLHQRRFPVNDVNARIHMTKEGLLLVSPAIFKQFERKNWSYVQKKFTRLKLHERSSNGKNIHEFLVSGQRKSGLLKGFLIADTANVFAGIELPTINHKLSRIEHSDAH